MLSSQYLLTTPWDCDPDSEHLSFRCSQSGPRNDPASHAQPSQFPPLSKVERCTLLTFRILFICMVALPVATLLCFPFRCHSQSQPVLCHLVCCQGLCILMLMCVIWVSSIFLPKSIGEKEESWQQWEESEVA